MLLLLVLGMLEVLLVLVAGAAALLLGDRSQLSAAFLPVTYSKSIRTAGTPNAMGPKIALDQPAEALLVKTLAEISNNRLDSALNWAIGRPPSPI